VSDWKKIGVNAVVRVENGNPQNFQALLAPEFIPQDPDQYLLWHSTQDKTNISHYKSDRIDKDLEDGRKATDPKFRKEKYLDFQKVLLDDAPATFLYFPKTNVLYLRKTKGLLYSVLPYEMPGSF
jgi:ABC-type transport system substrate-binding protein